MTEIIYPNFAKSQDGEIRLLRNRRIDELEEQVFYGNIDNIIVLDIEELKFVIRKAIQNIVRYNWIDENIHLALEYLSQLIVDIILGNSRGRQIFENPYVMDAVNNLSENQGVWNHKLAGDRASYGFLFYHKKKGNHMRQGDYLYLAQSHYHSGVFKNWLIPKLIGDILPKIEKISEIKLLSR